MVGQTRFLSSAVPVRALTGRILSRTWIFTSGCATRFRHHPGCSGAPPFDATMVIVVPTVDERELPDLAGPSARRVQDEGGRTVPVVPDLAAGGLVLPDVLGAE